MQKIQPFWNRRDWFWALKKRICINILLKLFFAKIQSDYPTSRMNSIFAAFKILFEMFLNFEILFELPFNNNA